MVVTKIQEQMHWSTKKSYRKTVVKVACMQLFQDIQMNSNTEDQEVNMYGKHIMEHDLVQEQKMWIFIGTKISLQKDVHQN